PFDSAGSSDFLPNEYPLVEYAEELGLDVTYCTDICVSEHPSFLLKHKALIGLDHDETWTNSERVGALDAMHAGVNMAFFGAATLVRHARLEPSPLGPDRQEVDYRDSTEDPLNGTGDPMEVTGNTWAAPPSNWTASTFTGDSYSGFLREGQPAQPLVVWDPGAWIFRGLTVTRGSTFPGMINSDIDHIRPGPALPQGTEVLAHSPIPLALVYTNQGSWNGATYSDMTYYTNPSSKAGVFSSGDNTWVATLEPCAGGGTGCSTAFARRVTANVFWLFGQGPAGTTQPSVPNWSDVTPPGS
ncbi:MAG: N,N-dimethylformamidase beta subunit family domain-containing protein, partial [Gemmatimonadales bacterium]